MAEKVREDRAEARERRRSHATKPSEQLEEAAGDEIDSTPTPLAAAKGVAATAAAAAVAGALAGAVKAFLERGSGPSDSGDDAPDEAQQPEAAETEERDEAQQPEAAETEERDEPQAEQRADADEREADEPEERDEARQPEAAETEEREEPEAEQRADSDEPEDDEAEAEAEPSPEDAHDAEHGEPDQAPVDEADTDEPSSEQGSDGTAAGSPSDAMQIVKQAREHLKNLLGADAESVSGIERTNGNWSVTFEVVEMRRIPESTDILSSYSAVLDDDGGIVSLTRGRRYRRSQVEEG